MTDAIIAEALDIVHSCRAQGCEARLLGGIAIAVHCATSDEISGYRTFPDIDLFTRFRDAKILKQILLNKGYEPNQMFNTLNGKERQIFTGSDWKMDVFVDSFSMCHKLDLVPRIQEDYPTLPLADLLLMKLQVVEIETKDLSDAALLLSHHEVGQDSREAIDSAYIAKLLSSDWGFYHTVERNLTKLALGNPDLVDKLSLIQEAMEEQPKTVGFRLRASVGERKRWYDLPEESIR